MALVRATRAAPAPSRLFWRPGFNLRLVLLLGLLLALAIAAAALVGALPSPRLYSNVFTPTGSLAVPRTEHTATLLHDGHVLVIGGDDAEGTGDASTNTTLASTELWDPGQGPSAPASRSRRHARATPRRSSLMVASSSSAASIPTIRRPHHRLVRTVGPDDRDLQPHRFAPRATPVAHRHAPSRRPRPRHRWRLHRRWWTLRARFRRALGSGDRLVHSDRVA